MSILWTAQQLRALQAQADAPTRAFNPKPYGSMLPGSKSTLALAALRVYAAENPGAWLSYGQLLHRMGVPKSPSIHWALHRLIERGRVERIEHETRGYYYRLTAAGRVARCQS